MVRDKCVTKVINYVFKFIFTTAKVFKRNGNFKFFLSFYFSYKRKVRGKLILQSEAFSWDPDQLSSFQEIEDSRYVTYPAEMDWSIRERVDWNVSFCKVLKDHKCAFLRSAGDFLPH